MDVVDDAANLRYLGRFNDQEILIEYKRRGDRIYLTHTTVPEVLSGQGFGKRIVEHVLSDIAGRKLELVAVCPFVKAYLHRHPEWNDLITII